MWYYRLCRRIGFVNKSIFANFDIYNFPSLLLFWYVSSILAILLFDMFSKEKLVTFICFFLLLFIVRPLIIIFYNRYLSNLSFIDGARYFIKDIKCITSKDMFHFFGTLFIYISYSFFATVTISFYVEKIISDVFEPDFFRNTVIKFIFSNENGIFFNYLYIICYAIITMIICYPLLSIIESNLQKANKKWECYRSNFILTNSFFIGMAMCICFLIYVKYMQLSDFSSAELKVMTEAEFELVKEELSAKASNVLKGLIFIFFMITILFNDYKVTRLYLKSRRKRV